MIWIRFDERGIVKSWSKFKRPAHIALSENEIPKNFFVSPTSYEMAIWNGELVGLKTKEEI